MEQVVKILELISKGGPESIIIILLIVIIALTWAYIKERSFNRQKDKKMETIFESYHQGTMSTTEAINELKLVLEQIKAKI